MAKIQQPAWALETPCLNSEQPFLELAACPDCSQIVAICADCGCGFASPRDLATGPPLHISTGSCPECNAIRLSAFSPARAVQILQAGLQPSEYE